MMTATQTRRFEVGDFGTIRMEWLEDEVSGETDSAIIGQVEYSDDGQLRPYIKPSAIAQHRITDAEYLLACDAGEAWAQG